MSLELLGAGRIKIGVAEHRPTEVPRPSGNGSASAGLPRSLRIVQPHRIPKELRAIRKSGFFYPKGIECGMARCKHEQLRKEGQ